MEAESTTFRLRELQKKDLPQLNEWRNDPEITNFLGNNFIYIAEEIDEIWYEVYLKNRNSQVRLAIEITNGKLYIGNVNLTSIHLVNRSAEFSILIGNKDFWSKGIGYQATQAMLHHGFENLNLNRVYLTVLQNHKRAIKLYEKCGFQSEGCHRSAIYKNGSYHDLNQMAVLRSDWNKLRQDNIGIEH